uniref:ARAD1B05940p n=1 Tax=Blastobotrys adeninivorans TaxID=409370 RepID=A0A060T5B2_BLAAD
MRAMRGRSYYDDPDSVLSYYLRGDTINRGTRSVSFPLSLDRTPIELLDETPPPESPDSTPGLANPSEVEESRKDTGSPTPSPSPNSGMGTGNRTPRPLRRRLASVNDVSRRSFAASTSMDDPLSGTESNGSITSTSSQSRPSTAATGNNTVPNITSHAGPNQGRASVAGDLMSSTPRKRGTGGSISLPTSANRSSTSFSTYSGFSPAKFRDELDDLGQRIEELKLTRPLSRRSRTSLGYAPERSSFGYSQDRNSFGYGQDSPASSSTQLALRRRSQFQDIDPNDLDELSASARFSDRTPGRRTRPLTAHNLRPPPPPPRPSLTRQTDAERYLLEVIEHARRVRDHDILVVLLERVVSDTMSLYNYLDTAEGPMVDRLCLSLSDFILRFVETSPDHNTETGKRSTANPPPPTTPRRPLSSLGTGFRNDRF